MKSGKRRRLALSVSTPHITVFQQFLTYPAGVKSYPRGVTTNSDGGIESYETYYPIFETMQEVDMVLNLHGEVPSDANAVRQLFREYIPSFEHYLLDRIFMS